MVLKPPPNGESAYPSLLSVNADIPSPLPSAKTSREQVQQTADLVDDPVGAGERCRGNIEPESLSCP
jgi:hypothetical protein